MSVCVFNEYFSHIWRFSNVIRAHTRLESRYSNSSGGSYDDDKSKFCYSVWWNFCVLVGVRNILMTGGGSLFKFYVNSNVTWPYRSLFYCHTSVNFLCLAWAQSNLFKGQRTSQKAAAENPPGSNTLNLLYTARRKSSKNITASTLKCALHQYYPPNQVLLYKHEEKL